MAHPSAVTVYAGVPRLSRSDVSWFDSASLNRMSHFRIEGVELADNLLVMSRGLWQDRFGPFRPNMAFGEVSCLTAEDALSGR